MNPPPGTSGQYHLPDAGELHPLPMSGWDGSPVRSWTAPSLRQQRGRIVLAVTGFALGAVLVLLGGPWRNWLIAPGPLSRHHALILREADGNKCAACHVAGGQSPSSWISLAMGSRPPVAPACQSDLCLRCHDRMASADRALLPHNLPDHQLRELTTATRARMAGAAGTIPVHAAAHTEPATTGCGTCHREHRGSGHSLTAMTDQQCQSCHVRQFAGFQDGHPEFATGTTGQMAIRFDHASHAGRHFPSRSQTFDCQSCHASGPGGAVRLFPDYQSACSSCHDPALRNSQTEGLELFVVPMIDVAAVRRTGADLPFWPEAASTAFDGRIPPLMRLLLAGDPQIQADILALPDRFDFADLDPGSISDLQLAARLAAGIVRLANELSAGSPEMLQQRLAAAVGSQPGQPPPLPDDIIRPLTGGAVRTALQGWFGGSNPDGRSVSLRDVSQHLDPVLARQANADDGLLAENPVRHLRGSSHSSQPALAQTVQPATPTFPGQASPPSQSASRDPAGPRSSSTVPADDRTSGRSPSGSAGSDVLAENPLAGMTGDAGTAAGGQPSSEPALPGLAEHLATRRLPPGNALHPQAENQPAPQPAASPLPFAPQLSRNGSPPRAGRGVAPGSSDWQVDQQRLAIIWPASGHADPWTRVWLDWAAEWPGDRSVSPASRQFRERFASADGPGQCALCHNIQPVRKWPPVDGDAVQILPASFHRGGNAVPEFGNWAVPVRNPAVRGWTRFSHAPHDLVARCDTCHALDDSTRPAASNSFAMGGAGPGLSGRQQAGTPPSGLVPAGKQVCASCHAPGGAPAGCTTCHNYHLTVPGSAPVD